MNRSLSYKLPFVLMLFGFAIVAPFLAFAQTLPNTGTYNLPVVWDPSTLGDQLLVCTGVPANMPVGPQNPNGYCKNLCDLVYQVVWIVYLAIAWVIWAIAPISFVAGGIMYMFGGANPGMETTARSVLKGAVIGVAIVLCSYIIINSVVVFFGIHGLGGFNGTAACTIS